VEFRLIYKGSLPAEGSGGSRAKEKQLLRKEFHKQLRELWKQHPDLREQSVRRYIRYTTPHNQVSYPGPGVESIMPDLTGDRSDAKTWLEHIADNHQRCGGRFVPLISKAGGLTCSLEITFLRRDNPGHLVTSGGDIDNRIKVLFDGLKMPETVSELGGVALESEEDPFFCLLEDDNLITSVSVTTDRLLLPQDSSAGERVHDVFLVIHVTMVDPSALFVGNRLI
jgi:hypothetical protein